MPWAATEVGQYGYHPGNAIDLGAVMPATEFRITDEEGAYLCAVQALIFKGSILVYNPDRNEAEWVPTNDFSWAEERSAVVLVNFVPSIPQEADRITELGARHLLGWSDDFPLEEEDDEQTQEEDGEPGGDEPEGDEHEETGGQEEADPKSLPSSDGTEQGKNREEAETWGQQCHL